MSFDRWCGGREPNWPTPAFVCAPAILFDSFLLRHLVFHNTGQLRPLIINVFFAQVDPNQGFFRVSKSNSKALPRSLSFCFSSNVPSQCTLGPTFALAALSTLAWDNKMLFSFHFFPKVSLLPSRFLTGNCARRPLLRWSVCQVQHVSCRLSSHQHAG